MKPRPLMSAYDINRYEKGVSRRFIQQSLNEYLQSVRRAEGESQEQLFEVLAHVLQPVFMWLADGAKPTNHSRAGTIHMRAWILLYALRPDLLSGETMKQAGERFDVSKGRMTQIMMELRQLLPALKVDTDSRKGHATDKAASAARKSESATCRWQRQRDLFNGKPSPVARQ